MNGALHDVRSIPGQPCTRQYRLEGESGMCVIPLRTQGHPSKGRRPRSSISSGVFGANHPTPYTGFLSSLLPTTLSPRPVLISLPSCCLQRPTFAPLIDPLYPYLPVSLQIGNICPRFLRPTNGVGSRFMHRLRRDQTSETNSASPSGCEPSAVRQKPAYAGRHGMVSLGDRGLSCLGVPQCHFESPEYRRIRPESAEG